MFSPPRSPPDVNMNSLRTLMIAFLFIVSLAVILVNGWMIMDTWQRGVRETENDARNLSQSVSKQSEDSILQVELTLEDLRDRINLMGLDTERQRNIANLLRERKDSLPQLHGLFIYDTTGTWLVTSEGVLQQHSNNSDREYFRFHRRSTDPGMHIGKVIRSRSTGDLVVPLSMRLSNLDGSFRGVLLATLRIDYFRQIFSYYNIGDQGLMALMLNNGTVLYARPFPDNTINLNISNSPLFNRLLKSASSGTATYKATLDGVERIFGYATLKRYPLVVTVAYGSAQLRQALMANLVMYLVLCVMLLLVIVAMGYLLLRNLSKHIQDQMELAQVRDQLTAMNHTLQTLALVDSLTGLANRRRFDLWLDRALLRANKLKTPIALLMIDVDFFKRFNDTYGHLAGDECLKQVGSALLQLVRGPEDLVTRYGGEEFAVILPGSEREEALRYAHNAVDAIAALAIPHSSTDIESKLVTVSVGVQVIGGGSGDATRQALIGLADKALYRAKASGKNRVGEA
ncbi:diguanylate cyclase [Erwinia sp. HDF1-3R]|uniref:sensor domain-containing diguanylate cyclase n=1 Tax=Erwinia sp. HDF1-3R TaxID=3141543 RepID=UPI0031F4EA8F